MNDHVHPVMAGILNAALPLCSIGPSGLGGDVQTDHAGRALPAKAAGSPPSGVDETSYGVAASLARLELAERVLHAFDLWRTKDIRLSDVDRLFDAWRELRCPQKDCGGAMAPHGIEDNGLPGAAFRRYGPGRTCDCCGHYDEKGGER